MILKDLKNIKKSNYKDNEIPKLKKAIIKIMKFRSKPIDWNRTIQPIPEQ